MKKSWQNDKLLEKISLKRVVLFNLYISLSTIFFGIISLIPILFLRLQTTAKLYWAGLLVLFSIFFILSPAALIILVSVLLSVEVFFLLETRKFSLFLNIFISSLVATIFLYSSFFLFKDYEFFIKLLEQVEEFRQKFLKHITPKELVQLLSQLPSLIIISFSFLLFFSLRLISFFKSSYTDAMAKKLSLNIFSTKSYLMQLKKRSFNFSTPSWVVWIFILSLILAFVDTTLPIVFKTLGINVLNICFSFYFLQGLGIVTDVLMLLKAKKITKNLIYILSFIYLFSFISVLGFLDYWFNFRKKIKIYKMINKNTPS
ncbi:MAG: DUF2232 domain-containing protein [Bdellovibrionales bacterium]|nr:DUF2232 domain-containing protein [Bdellovibrionales bacterium]